MDDGTLRAHVERTTGQPVNRMVFRSQHPSLVLGVELQSGEEVVAKARPWQQRLVACSRVHEWMAGQFPCARPIGELEEADGEAVSIETLVRGGHMLPRGPAQARAHATGLHRFVAIAAELDPMPQLGTVPWLNWASGTGLWPMPDDRDEDLNSVGVAGLTTLPAALETCSPRRRSRR